MSNDPVPEDVQKLLDRLMVPCRYFQMHPSSPLPFGYCWMKMSEIWFQGSVCNGCTKFRCGLFDLTVAKLPDKISGMLNIYDQVLTEIREGRAPVTWLVWQDFSRRVLERRKSAPAPAPAVKKSNSKTSELLRTLAETFPLAKYHLPKARGDESFYSYFCREYPNRSASHRHEGRSAIANFLTMLRDYVENHGIDLKADSVIARAREFRSAGKTIDDL